MTKQYTIRNVPSDLDAKLRAKAARDHLPLNSALLKVLEAGLEDAKTSSKINHDFDDLAGSWIEDPDFDEAMKDMRQVDLRDWQ